MNVEPGWQAIPLDRCLTVSVREGPLTPLDDRVDAIWATALLQRPTLFDGRVFVAASVSAARIEGYWTGYRHLFAQLRHPELFPPPHLQALAVNGLLTCADGVVLGRRRADAVYRPGFWQCVPAGSVESRDGQETVQLDQQLLSEAEEEIGLMSGDVDNVLPVLAIRHPGGRVLDIGCAMTTPLPFTEISRGWEERGNREYDLLRLVRFRDIPRVLRQSGPDLLASARLLLGRLGSGGEQFHDRLAEGR